jgi:hypothetical protein
MRMTRVAQRSTLVSSTTSCTPDRAELGGKLMFLASSFVFGFLLESLERVNSYQGVVSAPIAFFC